VREEEQADRSRSCNRRSRLQRAALFTVAINSGVCKLGAPTCGHRRRRYHRRRRRRLRRRCYCAPRFRAKYFSTLVAQLAWLFAGASN